MKKIILSAALLSSMAVIPASAKPNPATVAAVETPQTRVQIRRDRRNFRRSTRIVTSTRIVGYGRNRFRETIRTTYHPNGRVTVQVIRRERIGWGRRG